jgi:hypothetical protein
MSGKLTFWTRYVTLFQDLQLSYAYPLQNSIQDGYWMCMSIKSFAVGFDVLTVVAMKISIYLSYL